MGKDTRPGDRQGWIITDPDLAQRMEAHRKERKAIRRRQTAARITALVAAFLLGLAVGRYTRPPAQADEPEPPPATSTPAATVPATSEPTAADLWSDDRSRIDTPLLSSADLESETQWAIFTEVCGQDPSAFCAVMAIAYTESRFTPDLVGDDGLSFGVMQINTKWHTGRMEALGVADLTDPVQCAAVGLDYLQELARTTGSGLTDHALYMAYNMGPSGARKALEAGRTSTSYSEAVLEVYQEYMTEMEWAG